MTTESKWCDDTKFIITKHLRERYWERTHKKYAHLHHCTKKGCEICADMKEDIRKCIKEKGVDGEILERIVNSHEDKSFLNNTTFMQWYYEKYGYDHIPHFLVSHDLVFIMVIHRGRKIIVTCVPSKTHVAGKNAYRPKFKKAQPPDLTVTLGADSINQSTAE